MKRVMLLALLAMALPTVALATSVDYSTGDFTSGKFSGSLTTMIDISVTGIEHTIAVDTGTLSLQSSCVVAGAQCYSFSTGSVTVDDTSGNQLFMDSLKGGVLINDHGAITISASLAQQLPGVKFGSISEDFVLLGSGKVDAGSGNVSFTNTVPEPGTLGLLGTGLIGLAWMAKRKLKLPI